MSAALPQTIHVLHVDDEPDLAELTATHLERQSDRFDVGTATSASEGLDRIAASVPDCVVSDYNMPRMDGIEFLAAVREEHPDLPFLLYTGKGSEAVASDAISAGVTDYLQKRTGSEQYELLANRIRNAVGARHEARRAARQEELMRLTELAGDAGGFELNYETGDILLTDGARRLTGLSGDGSHSLTDVLALYLPGDRAEVRDAIERVAETGEETCGEWWLRSADGVERLLSVTIVPVDGTGDTTALRGCINDITEPRQRRRELEQIETLFRHAQDGLFLVDVGEEFTVERVNPGYEAATGFVAERICGQTPTELLGEEQGETLEARYRECVEQRVPLTYHEQLQFGGESTHWETSIAPVVLDDTVEYIAGSTRNVTEKREREAELEAERRLVQQALDTLDDLFYVLDVDGGLRRWNERVSSVTGYTDEQLAGMQATEFFRPEDRERVSEVIAATLEGDRPTVEADVVPADGTRIPYEFTVSRLTDGDGTTTGIVGIGRDLTERRQQERRFRALVEQSSDVISILDTEGRYQYQSPSIERILGSTPHDLFPTALAEEHDHFFREALAGNSHAYEQRYEGEQYRIRTVPVRLDSGNGDVEYGMAVAQNITEQARRRHQLERQNERLDEFASIVSHDLRNPLQVAHGRLELATDRTVRADPSRLRQLFENLFANAVEHGGTAVTVTVADTERGFAVEDSGPGIPETDRDRVFEAGYSTSAEGTGFGLRIVEQVATSHDWAVSLTDGTDGGARFEITGVDTVP